MKTSLTLVLLLVVELGYSQLIIAKPTPAQQKRWSKDCLNRFDVDLFLGIELSKAQESGLKHIKSEFEPRALKLYPPHTLSDRQKLNNLNVFYSLKIVHMLHSSQQEQLERNVDVIRIHFRTHRPLFIWGGDSYSW